MCPFIVVFGVVFEVNEVLFLFVVRANVEDGVNLVEPLLICCGLGWDRPVREVGCWFVIRTEECLVELWMCGGQCWRELKGDIGFLDCSDGKWS
jgi:hypothetical protein